MGTTFHAGHGFDGFMGTPSRSEQSQVNGSKSAGPVTPEGKAASARRVGSFGMASYAHGQQSVRTREAAVVVEEVSPARGPSAAPQDDISSSGSTGEADPSAGGLGSFGNKVTRPRTAVRGTPLNCAAGSFDEAVLGSFCTNAAVVGTNGPVLGSFRTNDIAAAGILGSFGAKAGAALRTAAHAAAPVSKMV